MGVAIKRRFVKAEWLDAFKAFLHIITDIGFVLNSDSDEDKFVEARERQY